MKYFFKNIYSIIGVFLIALCSSLPSYLVYIYSSNCNDCINFHQSTILFEEKFWIYYLEFKRQLLTNILSWPSSNNLFSDIFYTERLIPRLLYLPLKNYEYYFLYDSIIIFISTFVSIYFIAKILYHKGIPKMATIFSMGFFCIYNFRILILESQIPEFWFSRNPVASLSILLSIIIMFYQNKNNRNKVIVKQVALVFLLFTHTYSFMIMFGYSSIKFLLKMYYEKRINISNSIYLITVFLVFLSLYFNLSSNPGFNIFQKYYGAVSSFDINWNEFLKILLLLFVCIFFRKNKLVKNSLILIFVITILTNVQVITGTMLRDIHYRLYTLEWIVSLILVTGTYDYLKFNVSKLNVLILLIALSSSYILTYHNNFEYSCVNCTDNLEKCNYQSNMPGTILYYNPEQLNSCKLFIWDAPDYQYNYNMYKNCKGQNCKGWRRSTLHLYSE